MKHIPQNNHLEIKTFHITHNAKLSIKYPYILYESPGKSNIHLNTNKNKSCVLLGYFKHGMIFFNLSKAPQKPNVKFKIYQKHKASILVYIYLSYSILPEQSCNEKGNIW